MTLQSYSNIIDDDAAGPSSSSSSSGTLTEVASIPLGTQGEILIDSENQHLNQFFRDAALGGKTQAAQTLIVDSPGSMVGNKVIVNVEGTTHFMIKNFNGTDENGESKEAVPSSPDKPPTGRSIIKRHFKSIIIFITTITLVCAAALVALRLLGGNGGNSQWTTTTEEPSPPTTTNPPIIHHTFNRSVWGARSPSTNMTKLNSPVSLVVIKHTNTSTCNDVKSCFTAMQNLQNTDVGELKLADIRYNFVVGGDGNIYEGRGWQVENEQRNDSIDIAFMGNFNEEEPGDFMAGAGPWAIVRGMFLGYLHISGVKVVCHNQTEHTDSPGVNLYKKVITWQYYSDEIIFENNNLILTVLVN